MAVSVKVLGVAGRFWVIRFWVKLTSVARSRWKPVWLVALFVQVRVMEVAEAGVAPRPVGALGACGALGEKVQVRMSWVAVRPPVPPVKPTKAVPPPRWWGC